MKFKHQTFLLAILCISFMFSCSSNSDSDSVNYDNYAYFMSGKINGQSFLYGQETNATTLDYQLVLGNTLPAVCAYNPDTGGFNYVIGLYPNFDDETKPTMGINFVRFHLCTDEATQLETFNDKFTIGTYPFSETGEPSSGPTRQIGITYAANAQEGPYYTSYGGDLSNNSFEITSSTPFNAYVLDVLITAGQIVEGEFSATLYNVDDPTDTIEITEGRFKMIPSTD